MTEQKPNRFGWDDDQGWPTITVPVQCNSRAHRHPGPGWPSCKAFDEIPVALLTDDFDHRNAYAGDRGVRWQARE
jgi:hypothetical protein